MGNYLASQKLKNDMILFQLRSRSSAWLERRADNAEVPGSNPGAIIVDGFEHSAKQNFLDIQNKYILNTARTYGSLAFDSYESSGIRARSFLCFLNSLF